MRDYHFRPPAQPGPQPARRTKISVSLLVPITAVIVTGSGLFNLISLMRVPFPTSQPEWLHELFPLDFVGISRSVTLLLGFCLLLSAGHLLARKKRAVQLAIGLAIASGIFHLTKGWDVQEAVCSFGVAGLLFYVRKAFPLGSAKPDLPLAIKRAAAAFLFAGLYGAAGFWLLEPREFGRNFHWWEAVANTIRLMLFVSDSSLSPRTPDAVWFMDSLYLISAAAFVYCGVTLFRPVKYRFRRNESDRERARRIAEEFGRSGQDYFKHGPDKSIFFSQTRRSFLAYRVANHFALVLGDPVGPDEDVEAAARQFVEYCQRQGWRLSFHQVHPDRLWIYERLGFQKLKIGDEALVNLDLFSLRGSARKEFRNTVTRLDRAGYDVCRIDPPLSSATIEKLKRVSDEWLAIPGHRERRFTLGHFDPAYLRSTPVYVATDESGEIAAFLNLVPSYDISLETIDLMRRRGDSVNGLIDYLFANTFLDLKARGRRRCSLGMAPIAEFTENDAPTPDEKLVQWLVRQFPSLFRADSLRRFKAKYAHSWEPRFEVYQGRLDLPRIAKAIRSICEIQEEPVAKTKNAAA
jgi:phosphatidylglycerol lysyltransferase